jgi:hypothetical protein
VREFASTRLAPIVLPQSKNVRVEAFVGVLTLIQYVEAGSRQCLVPGAKTASQIPHIEATVLGILRLFNRIATEQLCDPL